MFTRNIKKIFISIMSASISLPLVACDSGTKQEENAVYNFGEEYLNFEEIFDSPSNSIDPEEVYSTIEYTEKMLHGVYSVQNEEKGIKDIRKNISFSDVSFSNGTFNISSLPISISSGTDYICDKVENYDYSDYKKITDREVAILEFVVTDSENLGTLPCVYEISGNTIKYTAVDITSSDEDEVEYTLQSDMCFEYQFSVKGPYLTLSTESESIELIAFAFTENNDHDYIELSGYSLEDSPLIDNLDYFCVSTDDWFNFAFDREGDSYEDMAAKLSDDGVATIYLKRRNSEDTIVKQFAYILNSKGSPFTTRSSIIFLDGKKEYYYTDDSLMREARQLGENDLSEDEIEEIADKKSDLFDDLQKEFKAQEINATINRATGEIALDSAVLFSGDSAEITADGKKVLNKFLKAYTDIIYNEKYDGFISKTVIEGHIAPIDGATYESGLPLSEERAENVKAYCLSDESGIDTSDLAETFETVGYSQSKPVYDSDGNIDLAACRRVSFRFVVNVESVE